MLCKNLKDYRLYLLGRDKDSTEETNYGIKGIPYVCFDALSNNVDYADRIPAIRRIYTFVSYYDGSSPMHDRPCAVNYIGSTYRTMEFCFPLHLMKNDPPVYPVFDVIEEMVKWFWVDLP